MKNTNINIGVIIDSEQLPHWAYLALKRVLDLPLVNTQLLIRYQTNGKAMPPALLYRLFDRFDRYLFKGSTAYDALVDIAPLFVDTPDSCLIDDNDVASLTLLSQQISKTQIQVLIYFGQKSLPKQLLDAPEWGVWSYHLADSSFNHGGLTGFWEAVKQRPASVAELVILPGKKQAGQILYRSESMTRSFKPTQNKQQYHYLAAGFISRQLNLLAQIGAQAFFQQINQYQRGLHFFSYPDFKTPDNLQTAAIWAKYASNLAGRLLRRIFYYEHWYLMVNLNPQTAQLLYQYERLVPPKDRFWADPHVIYENEKYYIFIEELMYRTHRGHIAVIEMDSNGNWKDPVTILKKDYHLSYPFVFKHNEKFYMIPESVQNDTIQLYESSQFPYQWEFKMNLMENVKAVDTTLFFKDNKWWLFTAIEDVPGAFYGDELFLFWSEELFSQDWTPHLLNPIVSGAASARPAGKIFQHQGCLIRPSQDCTVRYGHCTNLNEICTISETDYSEKRLSQITPNWDKAVLGTHTFNQVENLTIVDAYYDRRRFFN